VITLPIVEQAITELEWCVERGAKVVLIRPAPVPGFEGSRSFGLEEFDPFWQAVVDADVLVAMHASDAGYARYVNPWGGTREDLPFRPTAFRMVSQGKRPIEDAMAALICHGALSRFPQLRIASVENGGNWVAHLFEGLEDAYRKMPQAFLEDPLEVFRRQIC